jgi:hypothetical protein
MVSRDDAVPLDFKSPSPPAFNPPKGGISRLLPNIGSGFDPKGSALVKPLETTHVYSNIHDGYKLI